MTFDISRGALSFNTISATFKSSEGDAFQDDTYVGNAGTGIYPFLAVPGPSAFNE
jgi:hypothetical protein